MNVVSFLLGAFAGVWATVGFFMSVEVVRAYRENTDNDPWNEYASEEKPAIEPFDWERWKTTDELNQERQAKNEFYNREEIDTHDDEDL
jgi:hypothetical protein